MPTAPALRANVVKLVSGEPAEPDRTQVTGLAASRPRARATLVESDAVLAGKFRLIAPLGEGAMGKVWLAQHEALGRKVALKVLHRETHADAQLRERFQREVRAVAELDHPGIVGAFDCGTLGDGRTYLAMEYVEGRSLEQLLRSRGRLPWPALKRIARDILQALAYAHDHGFVHRDLKPANLIVCSGDPVSAPTRLLDLGIARRTDRLRGSTLTQAGEYIGTPAYSSPEQLRGERVGPRADLFSLGALLYRAATGELPFAGRSFAEVTYSQHQGAATPPVLLFADSQRPAAFDALLLSLLSREPRGRPASAHEALATLEAIDRLGAAAHPGRSRLALPLAAAVTLLSLGAIAGGVVATWLAG